MGIMNCVLRIKSWIRENRKEFWILVFILFVAAFCRLYKIDQYMTFLGDEGRDVITVRRFLVEGHPPLIGPGTSIGNMYLGPLYYYMMAFPLLIANFSPVGPAVQIALLGIITVAFTWWVGRTCFNKWAGAVTAGLYAISPTIIVYSRSSWNPNIMPFFALICIWAVWKVWRDKNFCWLPILGVSFAFVLQSHYLGLLLAPTLFIFWVAALLGIWRTDRRRVFVKDSLIGLVLFLFLMSPLAVFDARHNFINFRAMYTFFAERQTTVSARPWTAIPKLPEMLNLIDASLVSAKNSLGAVVVSIIISVGVVWIFVSNYLKKRNFKILPQYWLIISWIGFGLIGFGLYKQNIYDHYFGFMFAAPLLLIGLFISFLLSGGRVLKWLGIGLTVYLVAINLIRSPLRKEPNRLLERSRDVSKVIEENYGGKPFNLAVIAETNYEDGYKYFLLKDNFPVVDIDAQRPETITSQLFAVCELIPVEKCDPTHSPKAQVASFGWSKIENQWSVEGVIVYKLIHSK
jgi:4-amino-4-deoxy-L-arabinose transferase-like glycosyltransferase